MEVVTKSATDPSTSTSVSGPVVVAAIVMASLAFIAEAIFVLRSDLARLVATMPDDSFYYLEIARRAARGEGFTFDGINTTSGFHPLWQWILTSLQRVVPGETSFVMAARLLGLAMTAGGIAIVTRLVWRTAGPYPALGALLLASHGTLLLGVASDGMESSLVILVLALLLWSLHRLFTNGTTMSAVTTGALTATLCLARLDMAVAVPIVAVAIMGRMRSPRRLGAWAVGGALIGLPYALWHLTRNGGVLTTSAGVKRRWTSELVNGELGGWLSPGHLRELLVQAAAVMSQMIRDATSSPLGAMAGTLGGIAVLFLAIMGALSAGRRATKRTPRIGPAGAAALTVAVVLAAKFLMDLWTVPRWVAYWYSVPARVAVLLAIGAGAGTGLRFLMDEKRRATAGMALACAALVLLPSGTSDLVRPPNAIVGQLWQMELQRATDWVIAQGPDATYGAFDAGLLGYRLDGRHPLINLDGLVNDREFGRFLESEPSRLDIARREGVDILVNDLKVEYRNNELACARTLYEGAGSVQANAETAGPDRVYVLDLRPCG